MDGNVTVHTKGSGDDISSLKFQDLSLSSIKIYNEALKAERAKISTPDMSGSVFVGLPPACIPSAGPSHDLNNIDKIDNKNYKKHRKSVHRLKRHSNHPHRSRWFNSYKGVLVRDLVFYSFLYVIDLYKSNLVYEFDWNFD